MRKGSAVCFYKGSMASHTEVRSHVGRGEASRIQQPEAEKLGGVGGKGCGTVPDHGVPVRGFVAGTKVAPLQRRGIGGCIFAVQKEVRGVSRHVEGGAQRLGEAAAVHNIAEQAVGAWRHRGQRLAETAGACGTGMQVIHRVHLRPADRIQVHQVPVVRQQIVICAAVAPLIGDARIDEQQERAAAEAGMHRQGAEQIG